jgi:hypothetical protein
MRELNPKAALEWFNRDHFGAGSELLLRDIFDRKNVIPRLRAVSSRLIITFGWMKNHPSAMWKAAKRFSRILRDKETSRFIAP